MVRPWTREADDKADDEGSCGEAKMTDELKLTEKQRSALHALVTAGSIPYGLTPADIGTSYSVMRALAEKGLAIGGRVYGSQLAYIPTDRARELYRTTPVC